jgi:hypothetical protein
VLAVLAARQLPVSASERERILAITDVERLERMVRMAVTASTTAEIFE